MTWQGKSRGGLGEDKRWSKTRFKALAWRRTSRGVAVKSEEGVRCISLILKGKRGSAGKKPFETQNFKDKTK